MTTGLFLRMFIVTGSNSEAGAALRTTNPKLAFNGVGLGGWKRSDTRRYRKSKRQQWSDLQLSRDKM